MNSKFISLIYNLGFKKAIDTKYCNDYISFDRKSYITINPEHYDLYTEYELHKECIGMNLFSLKKKVYFLNKENSIESIYSFDPRTFLYTVKDVNGTMIMCSFSFDEFLLEKILNILYKGRFRNSRIEQILSNV